MYFRNMIFKRKINLVQLADIIINDLNIKRDDVVMVHTSIRNINLIDSHPQDLIYLLKMIVGTQGTLLMPTLAENRHKILNSELPYDNQSGFLRNDLINELFRQMPDTIQSCSPVESFAAWGKLAKNISECHNISETEIVKNSLFYELCLLKAKIIGIGVPLEDFSFLPPVGSTNNKFPELRYSGAIKKENVASNGEKFTGHYSQNLSDIIKSKYLYRISKLFEEDELRVFKKRGIMFFVVDAEKFHNKTLSLANNEIKI